jgi:hypothetical protein
MYVLYMCPIGNRMSPEQVISSFHGILEFLVENPTMARKSL